MTLLLEGPMSCSVPHLDWSCPSEGQGDRGLAEGSEKRGLGPQAPPWSLLWSGRTQDPHPEILWVPCSDNLAAVPWRPDHPVPSAGKAHTTPCTCLLQVQQVPKQGHPQHFRPVQIRGVALPGVQDWCPTSRCPLSGALCQRRNCPPSWSPPHLPVTQPHFLAAPTSPSPTVPSR